MFASIIVAKYNIFPRADKGRSREKKNSGEAIWSRSQRALSDRAEKGRATYKRPAIEILSTLALEFDCVALLAML